jgi:hypothetical protein
MDCSAPGSGNLSWYRLEKARSFAHAETYNFTEYDDIVVHIKKITDHLGRMSPSTPREPRPTAT